MPFPDSRLFLRGDPPEPSPYFGEYPPDFFDFIVVHECHRSGANDESTWREILDYFAPAVQLGLTASPTLVSDGKDGAVTLVARVDGVERRIVCGHGAWQKGRTGWAQLPVQSMAASGAWTADGTFTAKLCFYETPFTITVRLQYSGEELRYTSESNVGFGPIKQPQLMRKTE